MKNYHRFFTLRGRGRENHVKQSAKGALNEILLILGHGSFPPSGQVLQESPVETKLRVAMAYLQCWLHKAREIQVDLSDGDGGGGGGDDDGSGLLRLIVINGN